MRCLISMLAWSVLSLVAHAAEIAVREGSGEIARLIAIAPEVESDFDVTWHFFKKAANDNERDEKQSGTTESFTGETVGSPVGTLAHLSKHKVDGRLVYQLSIKKSPYHRYEIRLGKTIYMVTSDSELGLPPSKPAPPPIVWADFEAAEPKTFSRDVLQQIAGASVRLSGATGFGSATIVRGITEEFPELFEEDEVFALSAAHVLPAFLAGTKLKVEAFELRGTEIVSVECEGRLIFTSNAADYDIAGVAVRMPEKLRSRGVPLGDKRWPVFGRTYVQYGCPGVDSKTKKPRAPVAKYSRPISADVRPAPVITMDPSSVEGESGGGLFDTDGAVFAVLSSTDRTTDPITSRLTGGGLLRLDTASREPRSGGEVRVRSSIFTGVGRVRELLAAERDRVVESGRWKTVRVPILVNGRTSAHSEQGLTDLTAQFRAAVQQLPEDRRAAVQKEVDEAIRVYSDALREGSEHESR